MAEGSNEHEVTRRMIEAGVLALSGLDRGWNDEEIIARVYCAMRAAQAAGQNPEASQAIDLIALGFDQCPQVGRA